MTELQAPSQFLLEEQPFILALFFLILKILAIVIVLYLLFKKRPKRDFKKEQIKVEEVIDKNTIIIALQIKDLLVHVDSKNKPGFQLLQIPDTSNFIFKAIKKTFGCQYCYKTLFSNKQIHHFIKGLCSINNTKVILYTSLSEEVTDVLLKKINISDYFPKQSRKFCDLQQTDTLKHAISVDKDSRRVIIVTADKRDHSQQDQKYFLVIKPHKLKGKAFLKDNLNMIKTFIQNNKNRDFLHEEMGQLKIDVQESDYSDYHQV